MFALLSADTPYVKKVSIYTIADIATFPWVAKHDIHDIGLKKFKN